MGRSRAVLGAALCAAVLVPHAAGAAAKRHHTTSMCGANHWVSAWAMSPSEGGRVAVPSGSTLRQEVFAHYPGSRVRVHLTNRLSVQPVTFGAASLGLPLGGDATPALVPGTVVPLTFGGKRGITVPAGGSVWSDATAYPVTALTTLSVSLDVTSAPGGATGHLIGEETPWIDTAGGVADSSSGSGFGAAQLGKAPSYAGHQEVFYVDGVDVQAGPDTGTVAVVGDSLTDGYQARADGSASPQQVDHDTRWPDDLARRLHLAGRRLSVVDDGISGNQVVTDTPNAGPSLVDRLDADVLAESGVTTVILFEGINDLAFSQTAAAPIEAAYSRVIQRLHARGITVVLTTLTPAPGMPAFAENPRLELERMSINDWIRSSSGADSVLDAEKVLSAPDAPHAVNPSYDGGDHIHFNAAGNQALADAVDLGSLAGAVCGLPRRDL